MDPAVPGVFTSPYPFGIDPVWPSHSFNIHTVVSFVAAPVLILSHAVSTDLGDGQQQAELPELVQDEDVGHHRHHSHDLWSLLVILQLPVIHQVLPFLGGGVAHSFPISLIFVCCSPPCFCGFPQALWSDKQHVLRADPRASLHALSVWLPDLHGGLQVDCLPTHPV